MTEAVLLDLFVKAIARLEGWYAQGKIESVSQRLNNPCNLPHWKDHAGTPYPEVMGSVEFPDEETGWRAAKAQCKINILKRGLTFEEFFKGKPGVYKGFCPRDEGRDGATGRRVDAKAYARAVASALQPGTDIHVVIASLIDGWAEKHGTGLIERPAA